MEVQVGLVKIMIKLTAMDILGADNLLTQIEFI
jgi:hypothetical protein